MTAPDAPVSRPRRSLAAAMAATTLAVLPVTLIGALAVLLREDLAFSEAALGTAVSVWYLTAGTTSIACGYLSERLGAHRALLLAGALSVTCLLGIALVARSWGHLVAFVVVGGAGNSLAQPAINLLLARAIPARRQGLAFGVKQASIPVATFVGGIAVPVLGLTIGWRWAFALAALAAVPYWVLTPARGASTRPAGRRVWDRKGDAATLPLVVLGMAGACGVAASTAMLAFYVESAVARGIDVGLAGVMLAAGSACGIVSRVFFGWRSDRWGRGLPAVMWMLAVGAVGFLMLGLVRGELILVVGTLLAFGAGWGWPGLLQHATVRHNPIAPAAATGVLMTGTRLGGMLGPASFGLIVERTSHSVAWSTFAAVLLAGALLTRIARAQLRRDIVSRGGRLSR